MLLKVFFYNLKCKYYLNIIFLQFLGDEETVKKAMEAVAAQGTAKK